MEIHGASVSLMVRALMVSARWAARSCRLSLERACARGEAGRVAQLEARIMVLEDAFLRHGPPRHLISDQEGAFTGEVLTKLLRDWDVKHRLGAVGKHGSIAVTERLIWTLKREWLARVPLTRGLDHLGEVLADLGVYYNQCRSRRRLQGATPAMIHQGGHWQKPDRSAKTLRHPIRLRHFREQRIIVHGLAA